MMQTSTKMSRCERQYRADEASRWPDIPPEVRYLDTPTEFLLFAGVDWGTQAHEACLLDHAGARHTRTFAHSFEGLCALVQWLSRDALPHQLAVAIEVPHGPVVETLQAAGITVFAINPKQLDRFRDRHSLAGAKDDRLDAFVLADALRSDLPKFTRLAPLDGHARELREVSRIHRDLTADFQVQANRLWQQLVLSAPHLLALCPAANEPWFWDLLERLQDPSLALPRKDWLRRLLERHRKRAVTADRVLAVLRQPALVLPASEAATRHRIASLLPVLRLLHRERTRVHHNLAELVRRAGRVAEVIDSHIGIDLLITATFLAEAPGPLATANLAALRTLAGTAPVTRRSGKQHCVVMRRSCNPRLRDAVRNWARTSMRCDPYGSTLYTAMRARGLPHERALRGLADRLLACLVATLRSNSLYAPDHPSTRNVGLAP